MKRQIAAWGLGLAASTTLAAFLLASILRHPAPISAQPPLRRDPSSVTPVETELLLNRIREGDLHAIQGDLEGARKAWGEARRMGEGLWPIHEGLGDSFARAKLYDEAIAEYRAAATLVPEKHAAMRLGIAYKQAEALSAAGRHLKALEAYLEAGQPGALRAKIVEAALKAADWEAAVGLLARRAEIHDPRLYLLLSEVYGKFDRKAEAAAALARFAIQVAPWDEALDRQAIEGLRAAKDTGLALDVCRAWARAVPQSIEAWRRMGDLHREAGREREAVVAYSSIVDIRPGDAEAHRMLGDIFKQLNRVDDAIGQYEAAKKARPEDQATWIALVSLHDQKGDAAKSEETLLEATKRFGLSGELRSRLVGTYQERIAKLKSEGKGEEVRALRRKMADLNVAEAGLFDLKILMTWDAASDVDMDVYEPGGEHVVHGHAHSKAGGHYYVDNTQGFGPETYTLPKAAPGTYRVGAHLHGSVRSKVRFVVILFEDTSREERREETVVLEGGSNPVFIRDIVLPR